MTLEEYLAKPRVTQAELREMDYGCGEYLGERWIARAREYLEEMQIAWPEIKDDQQRRACQEGIRRMMGYIALRKAGTEREKEHWTRFREECDKLTEDWNDLWFFGEGKPLEPSPLLAFVERFDPP